MPKNKRYRYESFDDDYYKYESTVHERAARYNKTKDEGFMNYEPTTVDPGSWVFITTMIFCFGIMLIVVPLLVGQKRKKIKKRKRKRRKQIGTGDNIGLNEPLSTATTTTDPTTTDPTTVASTTPTTKKKKLMPTILAWDDETKQILKLAIPYSISTLSSTTMSNICLGLIGNYVGTKAIAAYALVQILLALTDGVLYGPINACTTVCAHAVGASNPTLAGQYIQIAIIVYMISSIPVIMFWWTFMEEFILYIEWGDVETAALAQDFTHVYIWTYVLGALSTSLWQLLEVAGHVVEGTIFSIVWGMVNVLVTSFLIFGRGTSNSTSLFQVGVAYVITSAFFVGVTYWYADYYKGWIKPFKSGLFGSNALMKNHDAVKTLMKQGVPLGLGYILSNAEWTALTFFASYLGPAEVAAWAILGSIWDIFYKVTTGISNAGEMRVAQYLGKSAPEMAKIAGYKALLLSMSVATVVSLVFFSLQDSIPKWFTVDETLQGMLRETIPFVGIGNLTMQFGMTSWSLIGAQGKYKLATWVSALSDWIICIPLASIFCFVLNYDLKGLTSAVVIGYVCTGAVLSYVLLGTHWEKVANKIKNANAATSDDETITKEEENNNNNNNNKQDDSNNKTNDDNDNVATAATTTNNVNDDDINDANENAIYAALHAGRSEAARMVATGNIRLVVLPAGVSSGLVVDERIMPGKCVVLLVKNWSPLLHQITPGDVILSLDGQDVTNNGMMMMNVSDMLKDPTEQDRQLVVVSPEGTPNATIGTYILGGCSGDNHMTQVWEDDYDDDDDDGDLEAVYAYSSSSGSTDDESKDGDDDKKDDEKQDNNNNNYYSMVT